MGQCGDLDQKTSSKTTGCWADNVDDVDEPINRYIPYGIWLTPLASSRKKRGFKQVYHRLERTLRVVNQIRYRQR